MLSKIREEEIKNVIRKSYFSDFDGEKVLGDIDFCVSIPNSSNDVFGLQSLLWAEAKNKGNTIITSIAQLVLTIGKARTFDTYLPPAFLGSFDTHQIGIIPYNEIHDIFYLSDFNWNVRPSDHTTKEFKQVLEKLTVTLDKQFIIFNFATDEKELKKYIKSNFVIGKTKQSKIRIDKNNFVSIYNKWLKIVKPSIDINWDDAKKKGIIDGDFYLADILSIKNESLSVKLDVLLKTDHYEFDKKIDEVGLLFRTTQFTDRQKSHNQFWNKYERPPKKVFWDLMVLRRDLLVPQDIRERKGSYFTPQVWVELSQEYLTCELGEDWQEEYYIWDCAAGTGNLLTGLTDKYRIWASTIDKQDVDVMHERIETMNNNSKQGDGANLLHDHVFQFDFLNDSFSKLPKHLKDIIDTPEKRAKLLIYINPPYAEHGNRAAISDHGEHKPNVANKNKVYDEFSKIVGTSARELFIQFFLRIYRDLPDSTLASFSTLKFVNSPNFSGFRNYFKASFKTGFVCKADTFDNVKGKFPIGFLLWKLDNKALFKSISVDVFEKDGDIISKKNFFIIEKNRYIINWFRPFIDRTKNELGSLHLHSNDMQQQNVISITSVPSPSDLIQKTFTYITRFNLIPASIYYAVRHCIDPTWLNNRDQFIFPNDDWETDTDFQNDCLTFTIFSNNIQSKYGANNWIPFTEQEINSHEKFDSTFMSKFINGKLKIEDSLNLFGFKSNRNTPLIFSQEATQVFDSGRALWKYYHKQPECNANASLHDIREYFQGRNEIGKMNNKSQDENFNTLISILRHELKELSEKIESKIYELGFLKK